MADIVYNPHRTALLLDAEERGVPAIRALPMLAAQAKRAAELFTGILIDDGVIGEITDKILRQTRNVALIGMPGCGKSTTGRELARQLGRSFYDTDALVEERAGKSIPRIFEEDGEDEIRSLETAALRDVSKESGAVIATGGGIVKRSENRRLLRQNSVLVFLDRAPESLPLEGRPLSVKNGVKALAGERLPLYNEWCDVKVPAAGVAETVKCIRELFGL